MHAAKQESRLSTIGIAVTPTEKRLVEVVLLRHPDAGGASNLLRERSLNDVIREGREIMARLMDSTEGAA